MNVRVRVFIASFLFSLNFAAVDQRWELMIQPMLFPNFLTVNFQAVNKTLSHIKWYNVYSSTQPRFTYYDPAVTPIKFPTFKAFYSIENVSAAAFATNPHELLVPRYFYHSGNIMNSNFDDLRKLLDVERLVAERSVTSNVWAGSQDVVATAHYDTVYNVYLHLIGKKVFRLLPPRSMVELFIAGRYHPHACQSRVLNLSEGCTSAFQFYLFPNGHDAEKKCTHKSISSTASKRKQCELRWDGAVEFVLEPGDVLFIPPFWVHETETLMTSVSVSFWWDAPELDVMDAVYSIALPFQDAWDINFTRLAAFKFVSKILISLQSMLDQIFNCDNQCQSIRKRSTYSKPESVQALNVWSVARVLLMNRYAEDFQNRICSNKNVSCDCFRSGKAPFPANIDDTTTLLMSRYESAQNGGSGNLSMDEQQLDTRANEFASVFIRMLSLHPGASISDRFVVMMVKVCDYVEDVFQFSSTQGSHPTLMLFDWLEQFSA